mmetsp:Transcript_20312/g.41601  ORF Transcript_20312/g.41601 Transcript_20312/m.41601 type:complete len:100 (-) Transcript_20312:98-397(-)
MTTQHRRLQCWNGSAHVTDEARVLKNLQAEQEEPKQDQTSPPTAKPEPQKEHHSKKKASARAGTAICRAATPNCRATVVMNANRARLLASANALTSPNT